MYLEYDEYKTMGGQMEQLEFERYEYKARRYIDAQTHNRIRDEVPVRECVRRAVFELISLLESKSKTDANAAAGVSSSRNDGLSVTYASSNSVNRYWQQRQRRTLCEYLIDEVDSRGVPLLYAGVEYDGGASP